MNENQGILINGEFHSHPRERTLHPFGNLLLIFYRNEHTVWIEARQDVVHGLLPKRRNIKCIYIFVLEVLEELVHRRPPVERYRFPETQTDADARNEEGSDPKNYALRSHCRSNCSMRTPAFSRKRRPLSSLYFLRYTRRFIPA